MCEDAGNLGIRGKAHRYVILEGEGIPEEYILRSHELDTLVYEGSAIVPEEMCAAWYAANKDIYTVILDAAGKIAACANLSPIKEGVYEDIIKGRLTDGSLPAEAILKYKKPGLYDLYVSSVAVHPAHRGRGIFLAIINSVADKLIHLSKEGIFFRRAAANAVTCSGARLCLLFGMHELAAENGARIFELSMLPPTFNTPTKQYKELYRIYSRHSQFM